MGCGLESRFLANPTKPFEHDIRVSKQLHETVLAVRDWLTVRDIQCQTMPSSPCGVVSKEDIARGLDTSVETRPG